MQESFIVAAGTFIFGYSGLAARFFPEVSSTFYTPASCALGAAVTDIGYNLVQGVTISWKKVGTYALGAAIGSAIFGMVSNGMGLAPGTQLGIASLGGAIGAAYLVKTNMFM